MMLDWLGHNRQHPVLADAGAKLREAVAAVIAGGEARTRDCGGTATTEQFAAAVESRLA
jgi:isocitrate/isopropylmalate dehydrogenase